MMQSCTSCQIELPQNCRFCPACGAAVAAGDVTGPYHPAESASAKAPSSEPVDGVRFAPGEVLAGRFRIVHRIGKGGMGEVYRADDLRLGQAVVLKFLPKEVTDDPKRLEFFHEEVKLSRQIAHPNVCRVYDIAEHEGQPFLSMEYIDGEDLAVLLKRIGRLPSDKGVQVAQQLCAGLAAAHDRGVIHRDLKPANIMIDGKGHARIIDFGLARLVDKLEDGDARSGTPMYMAPEQLAGREVTARSDLYALGLILYELFTGKRAFESGSLDELERLRTESSVVTPSSITPEIEPAVEKVILRCLEKEPAQRPPSARAVVAALPGGDPLAAALAAGETPSPEMVAAAGEAGGLSLKVGGALFAVLCMMLAAVPLIADWRDPFQMDPGMDKPAVFEKKAQSLIKNLDWSTSSITSIHGFQLNEKKDGFEYWYRQSSHPLVPAMPNLWSLPVKWRVTWGNPPPIDPGMVGVRLNPAGYLIELLAVPEGAIPPGPGHLVSQTIGVQALALSGGPIVAAAHFIVASKVAESDAFALAIPSVHDDEEKSVADWEENLSPLTGLNFDELTGEELQEAPPGVTIPVYADKVMIWKNQGSGDPKALLATRSGRPVYFLRLTKGVKKSGNGASSIWTDNLGERVLVPLFGIVLIFFAGLLALRHLRMGRADTKGALRCALYFFAIDMILWLLAVHHDGSAERELHLAVNYLARSLAAALRIWLYYVALEPVVRRLWPDMLISWSRLLSGRFRDALVGRDLLVGCLWGATMMLLALLIGRPTNPLQPSTILGGRFVASEILNAHQFAIIIGLWYLTILLLVRILFRRTWLALIAFTILTMLFVIPISAFSDPRVLAWVVFFASFGALYVRGGLLCAISGLFAYHLLVVFPYSVGAEWYSYAGYYALGTLVLLGSFGFYTSTLAGRSLFGEGLLGDKPKAA